MCTGAFRDQTIVVEGVDESEVEADPRICRIVECDRAVELVEYMAGGDTGELRGTQSTLRVASRRAL